MPQFEASHALVNDAPKVFNYALKVFNYAPNIFIIEVPGVKYNGALQGAPFG
jgi:hypothetical protein